MSLLTRTNMNEVSQRMIQALREENEEDFQTAFNNLGEVIEQNVLSQYHESQDSNIMLARGQRPLTSEERKFYTEWANAGLSANPKQALTNANVTFPETIIDQVFDDITEQHPLLSAINFVNTSGAIKFLVSKSGRPTAKWGALTAEITQEIDADLAEVDMSLEMLSAFIPVPKAILDLGPTWLDNYVRTYLSESIANGLEAGIVANLNTKTGPVGMMADLSKGSANTDGDGITYTAKSATAITDLSPHTVGKELAKLAKAENGNYRSVDNVVLIVNPVDYFNKVFPATTVLNGSGTYVNNVLPYPMAVIQSNAVTEGQAIIGLAKRYFMGLGVSGQGGRIEFSDEYKFIEHKRYYKTYLYGNGKPMDNNAFSVLDISGLKPASLLVTQVTSA